MTNLLLTNPGFEWGTYTGWSTVGNSVSNFTTYNNVPGHSGSWYATFAVYSTGPAGVLTAVDQRALVTAGETYRFSIWGRLETSSPVPLIVTAEFYDNAGISKGSTTIFNGTDSNLAYTWVERAANVVAPVGATKAGVKIVIVNAGSTMLYRIDDAAIEFVPTAPIAPSGMVVTHPATFSLKCDWTDNSSNELDFYVQRSVNGGSFADLNWVAAGVTTYTDTTVTASNTYAYKVRAENAAGSSTYSNTASFTIPSPPAAPSVLTAVIASLLHILVSWTDNSSDETGFVIQRSVNGGAFADLTTPAANATSYTDATVFSGNTYAYKVCASNDYGRSTYSNTDAVTTPPGSQITGLASVTGLGSITF